MMYVPGSTSVVDVAESIGRVRRRLLEEAAPAVQVGVRDSRRSGHGYHEIDVMLEPGDDVSGCRPGRAGR